MRNNNVVTKTVSPAEALSAFEAQRHLYPAGGAWGVADPDYVAKEIEQLADSNNRVSLTRLSSLLLRLHTGRSPGDVNKALQGIIRCLYISRSRRNYRHSDFI